MKYDVFISYSRYDTNVVNEFVTELESEGFSVWIDRDGIESGDAFKRVILRAIKESQVVLFFSSEHSNQSDWTAKEIGVAVKYKKHIIPIKLDDSNFNEDVEFDLINLDFVDFTDESKRTGMKKRMLKTLRNKLGKEQERLEAERKAKEETERRDRETEVEDWADRERKRLKAEQERIKKEIEEERKKKACSLGAINGVFSVSPTKQVYFSKGNLQYNISTKTWLFAEQQFEVIGEGNGKFEETEVKMNLLKKMKFVSDCRDTIDLFGWGTGNNPTNYSDDNGEYGDFSDWGRNKIVNGSDGWQTLTYDEWKYVLEGRFTKSSIRYAKACVNNVNGVILLPDNWKCDYYTLKNSNERSSSFTSNVIDFSAWTELLQPFGAVFLPAAGIRNVIDLTKSLPTSVDDVGSYGCYWSSSDLNSSGACYMYFNDDDLHTDYASIRYCGRSVRLVYPIE